MEQEAKAEDGRRAAELALDHSGPPEQVKLPVTVHARTSTTPLGRVRRTRRPSPQIGCWRGHPIWSYADEWTGMHHGGASGHRNESMMTDEETKAAARRFFEAGWNTGDPAELKAFLADEFVSHNSLAIAIQSADDYCRGVTAYREAFPDLVSSVDDVIAAGDRVVVRGTDRATHRGEFLGKAASGRSITTTWIEIFRLESGKAVEGWLEADIKGLIDQIDA